MHYVIRAMTGKYVAYRNGERTYCDDQKNARIFVDYQAAEREIRGGDDEIILTVGDDGCIRDN